MFKVQEESLRWAMKHLLREGDTDLFPTPFEFECLNASVDQVVSELKDVDLDNYPWNQGRRFIVPKDLLAFRAATQLHPIDSLLIASLVYEHGAEIEQARCTASEGVCSYRFAPTADGLLYGSGSTWHDFWQSSLARANQPRCSHVLVADVADFYNQVYHHSIERFVEDKTTLPHGVLKTIIRFLQALTDKVSRGIPVGPHAVHLLAECALDSTDRSLRSKGYDFCRYVDDMHIFCSSELAAVGAAYDLAETLDNQQRLILQKHKTRIVPAAEFVQEAREMLVERPRTPAEAKLIHAVSASTGGDPYRRVAPSAVAPSDRIALADAEVEGLLHAYLRESKLDYPRVAWLLRRLTQVGAPGALQLVVGQLERLSPVLGSASRYVTAAVPNYVGDVETLGSQIAAALETPTVNRSPYLQTVLLDVIAARPSLNHVDKVTARFPTSAPAVQREIIRVATAAKRSEWLRDVKASADQMEPWTKRALVAAMTVLSEEERKAWAAPAQRRLSGLERWVARHYLGPSLIKSPGKLVP